MSAARQIAWAWAHRHRGRMVLTAAAMALATSLVVFTVSGYRSAVDKNAVFAQQILGATDVLVVPRYAVQPRISNDIEQQLRLDDDVRSVVRGQSIFVDIEDKNDTTYYDFWRAPMLYLPLESMPVALAEGVWPTGKSAPGVVAGVVSGGLARRWQAQIGDTFPMHTPGGELTLRVVGVTDEFLAYGEVSGVYVSAAGMQLVSGGTRPTDRLLVDLHAAVDRKHWLQNWSTPLREAQPPAKAMDVADVATALGADGAAKRLRGMGSAGAAIALLAAAFIVWTSVAAGVTEKRRELAMLRAIGSTRRQIMAMVMWESVALAMVGGLIGVPLGWVWLQVLAIAQADFFNGLIIPDGFGLVAGVLTTVVTGLGAGLLPAWSAARMAPLESMTHASTHIARGPSFMRGMLAVCVFLVAVMAVMRGDIIAVTIGVPAIIAAVVLSAPWMLRLCQAAPARGLARIMGVAPGVMQMQQQADVRSARGMVLTLAVCLSLSVTMNAWGRTMVIPFLPTPDLPDQVISILPSGVPFSASHEIDSVNGLDAQRVLPLAVEQVALGREFLARTSGAMDELYIQIMGVDPQQAWPADSDHLLPVRSDQDISMLAQDLEQPGTCIIPASLAERFGLSVGDDLSVARMGMGRGEASLRIVALASLPGWQWVSKMGRMRSLGAKPLAPVVVGLQTAQDLGIANIRHWLADTTSDFDRAQARQQLQAVAERHAGAYTSAHFGPGMSGKPSVKIIGTGVVGERMQTQADSVIWVLGAIPLASLLVAMLGVANAIAMGIRVRSWSFGIVRAIGLERSSLRRAVMIEAGILALAAGLISIPAGLLLAASGIDVSVQAFNTGTATPALVIPWLDIFIAWLITGAAAVLAAWWPARDLGRRDVLSLLAAGRAGAD